MAAWTLAIYVTLPVAPEVWRALQRSTGGAVRHLTAGLVVLALALLIVRLLRRRCRPARLLALASIAGAYAAALALLPLTDGERTHFLSYGLLAWLAYRALVIDLTPMAGAVAAVLVASAAGFGDELVQAVLPNRFFEWKDVGLNALSSALATALVAVAAPSADAVEQP